MLGSGELRPTLSLIALLVTALAGAGAQRPADTASLAAVQALVDAGYPELAGRGYTVRISLSGQLDTNWPSLAVVGVVITPPGEEPDHPSASHQDQPFLTAFCHVDRPGAYVESATFKGRHVHERENHELTELARAHPEWTVTDIQTRLTRAGAKYGPDKREAFLRDLKIERFAGALGEIRKAVTAFSLRRDVAGHPRPDVVWPMWVVTLETLTNRNVRMCHLMSFELRIPRIVITRSTPS